MDSIDIPFPSPDKLESKIDSPLKEMDTTYHHHQELPSFQPEPPSFQPETLQPQETPSNASKRRASYKRRREEDVTLDGFSFKETEDGGYIEIWEKQVKKGIKAKHAKCIAPLINQRGEVIGTCGKIFGRVPNCKRHLRSIHQKLMVDPQAAPPKRAKQGPVNIPAPPIELVSTYQEAPQQPQQLELQMQQIPILQSNNDHVVVISEEIESPLSELTESLSNSPASDLHESAVENISPNHTKTIIPEMNVKQNDETVWIHSYEEKHIIQKDFDTLYDTLFHTDKELL